MSARRIVGLVLLVVGIVVMAWGGVFWTNRDTVLDAGSLQIVTEKREGVRLPPLIGALGVIAGIVLLVVPVRSRT
jgi:hypothetical protein